MAATEEATRHEGGPLEKNHLKDMVQRNAMEAMVFDKITKHIEIEKKAFTRQNTRDETEMKHLLVRLHQEQQTTFLDDDDHSSAESEDEAEAEKSDGTDDTPVNPYPVTIIPKYGAASQAKPATKLDSQKHKQDQNEDFQQSPIGSAVRTRDRKKEWLGDPEAIQSIRRPRKSSDSRSLMRSKSEQDVLGEMSLYMSLPPSSTSSQSSLLLSPRDRSNSFGFWKDGIDEGSEGRTGTLNKRGGSLKERPKKSCDPSTKPLVRSYSMLTKAPLNELKNTSGVLSRPNGIEAIALANQKENSQVGRNWRRTKHGSLKEKRSSNNAIPQITETYVQKKQPLSRKSSREENEGDVYKYDHQGQQPIIRKNSYETKRKTRQASRKSSTSSIDSCASIESNVFPKVLGHSKKQSFHPNSLSPHESPNDSPNISPLAREHLVFRY